MQTIKEYLEEKKLNLDENIEELRRIIINTGQKLRELNMHETMTVYGGEHLTIECMRVPGGFIYQYSEYHPSENEHLTTSTVFVPEPMQLEYSTSQEINMDKLFEE